MPFIFIGRVLMARWLIVAVATAASLAGALLMLAITTPGYDAKNRVQLDLVKTDPITGFHLNAKYADAYMSAQMAEIRDYQVAIVAVERLGWLDSPDLQAQYASLPVGTAQDFNHWVASRMISGIGVRPVDGTNLLEIKYRGVSPQVALLIAEEVRNAYVQNTSATEAAGAQEALPRVRALVDQAAQHLADLQARKAAFERESGMVLLDAMTMKDIDNVAMYRLARSAPARAPKARDEGPTTGAARLMQLDDAIAQSSKELGPNNPKLIELKRERERTAQQMATHSASQDAQQLELGNQRQLASAIEAQRQRVLGQSEKRVQLRLLQDEINRQQKRYDKLADQMGHLQQMSRGGGGNITPIGITEVSQTPSYPIPALVLGGSGALGLAAGVLLAFLAEMWARRVRVASDLTLIEGRNTLTIPMIRHAGVPRFRLRLARAFLRQRAAA